MKDKLNGASEHFVKQLNNGHSDIQVRATSLKHSDETGIGKGTKKPPKRTTNLGLG